MARLLIMGIWNECDDTGSFAWSPLTLKMRVLPADNVDAAELLAEIVSAGIVLHYEVAGKSYGAVRNFCQFQRPKKPNSIHPQTDEVRAWVNTEARSTRDGGEDVPNQLPTESEKSRQMEDGGGKGNSSEAIASAAEPAADPVKEVFDLGVSILVASGTDEKRARSLLGKWRKERGEAKVLTALLECRTKGVSEPVVWLTKRLQAARYVSPSGYEYRGSVDDVIREAERRNDMDIYWRAKGDRDGRAAQPATAAGARC
jgi:hypothetical protein